jgi:prevent-host-death family protein
LIYVKTYALAEAKANLSRIVDAVSRRDERVTITRKGRPAAVLVSPEEYESWAATLEILADPDFLAEIRRGVRGLKRARTYTVAELFER